MGNTFDSTADKLGLSARRYGGSEQPSAPTKALRAGQHVRIDGRDEVYLILRVDKTRHLADLLRQGAVRKVQAGVPLALLSAVDMSAAHTREASEPIDDTQLTEQAS